MSRIRMVKPAFFKHADLYDAEVSSGLPLRIAFAGLWTVADRRGVFPWSRNIKPDVLPYDPCDMLAVLEALTRAGFVESYEVEGKRYGIIPSFTTHQTFHKNEAPSPCPAPPQHGASTVQAPELHSSRPAVSITGTGTSTGTVNSPPAARGASNAEEQLRVLAGDDFAPIAAFLDSRPSTVRAEWATDLLQLVGPATGNIPADLARACRDGQLASPPVTNAKTLRIFVASCREERIRSVIGSREPTDRAEPRSEAGALLAQIRDMVKTVNTPGNGVRRYIPQAEVELLGPIVFDAYRRVGGADRILNEKPEKLGLLVRDFADAFRAAQRAARTGDPPAHAVAS